MNRYSDGRGDASSIAPFRVRDWLAQRVPCAPEDLVADDQANMGAWSGSQTTYRRDGEWAAAVSISNIHGRTGSPRGTPYRVLTAQWRGGSATARLKADEPLHW